MATTEFGKMVKKALIDMDMTQTDLASAVGTSRRYIGFILTGDRSPGRYEQPIRAALASVLNHIDTAS